MLNIFKKKDDEKDILLGLVEERGEIKLVVVDEEGMPIVGGYLLCINKKTKKAYRCDNVSKEYGFTLDREGRLIIEDEFTYKEY